MTQKKPDYWIQHLRLQPHPEGGYFRESYRSTERIPTQGLPARFQSSRSMSTSIFYLLTEGDFSAFHRIRSDETWYFQAGGVLEVHVLHEGNYFWQALGPDLHHGQALQWTVPAGAWFASCVQDRSGYALVGCSVSPGFDFEDFELAERDSLLAEYPSHEALIRRWTRTHNQHDSVP